MKNIFALIAVGIILHRPGLGSVQLDEVPATAQEDWENGEHWLFLRPDNSDFLKQYSKTKLQEILKARKPLNIATEITQLEKALEEKSQEESKKSQVADDPKAKSPEPTKTVTGK